MAIYTIDVLGTETRYQSFLRAVTSTWYEWVDDAMKTFLERLQAALEADATLLTYNTKVVVLAERHLSRYEVPKVYALDKSHVIIVHGAEESFAVETSQGFGGRDDLLLKTEITAVAKTAKTVDATTRREVAFIGDGSRKGVVTMQDDIRKVLWNNGALHLFPDGGGVPYLWNLDIGPSRVQTFEDETSLYLTATRTVTGHKWLTYW